MHKSKGIYCVEGLWETDIKNKATVLPMLELLEKRGICKFIYHDCATRHELEFYLKKWKRKSISDKYPILYLTFHGDPGEITISPNEIYTLEDLGEFLRNKCYGKIVYFGSCSTLDLNKKTIKNFLSKINAIATIGYKTDVEWIKSTACDLLVFDAIQKGSLDTRGIEKIKEMIKSDYRNLYKSLELTVVINDRTHFPRKRTG
ncbi:MAG: hypothetical protein OZ913_06050 [Ignavibacteriaceae bacterium]|nr:MAG: hypothetical protein EDM69_08870 [Chlorobiota bacterium]KXK01797.1 MAG: hypothetical protein UZ04_CHB001002077 [Chlorobi bacterium OLB4]MBV6399310.1 hypothetical protein [Ignavibacteria bacterium]MCC6886754.1 hypothetical protein [Ignavibacteriales bacterium]MCE7953691.1 hypothetical protein [Chlorobi bacterium CHB7]MDL1887627.1 hypothetical protein [Ignavibacteria bacterium CHB1]MEB2329848.1 hypothetical protein [Ignavibacteriaceae bacterium]OQY77540.1 MAG: hypothetical protein B6D4